LWKWEPAKVYAEPVQVPVGPDPGGPLLEQIRRRGLRAGYIAGNVPFSYLNGRSELVGYDVERAHQLAHDLDVPLALVPVEREALLDALDGDYCDVAMSGIVLTADRAARVLFSGSYMDETLAFVVPDHQRQAFSTWAGVRAMRGLRLGVPRLPHLDQAIRRELPEAEIVLYASPSEMLDSPGAVDALVLTAERGSVWTLLHPQYSVVVPQPRPVRVPLAYPVARGDQAFVELLNGWIELKRKDGTADALYEHWILGREPAQRERRRWSVLKDVLGWDRP
jgi:ABC-type amino acid transport substrate-binding protein